MSFLPGQNWNVTPESKPADPVVPRDDLNGSAVGAADTQTTQIAENAPLRVIYGQPRLGPLVAYALKHNGADVILAVWGHGEVDSVVELQIDDKDLPAGVTATHYTGTAGQGIDPTLVAAFAAQTPAVIYTDALPGICYSVVTVPQGAASGFPRLAAIVKGLKVWTGAASEWSDNPAYCLADFITNEVYGMGRTVDWASVASVSADCDALVGAAPDQEKRRTLNLALETVQPVQAWIDTLRTYASCWVIPSGPDLKLVSDKPGASVASYSHAAGSIQSISGIKKRGVQSMPTVLTVTYTDTSVKPYRDKPAVAYAAGVEAGTTPRRESTVSLPGINRYSQALREATERLNKLLLNDLSMTLNVFDDGLAREVGDIVDVTHPIGFAAKLLRVMGVSGNYGRFALALAEYDPAVYNDTVATAPTWADTTMPSPTSPPAVTGVVMTEEVFQLENGNYSSRWRVTWNAAAYAYLARYRAELWAGSTLIHAGSADSAEWPTPAVQEGVAYTAKIAAVSSIGAVGAWGTQSAVAAGKALVPGDVPSISAFEAGGVVYLSWSPATDIDIWRYEARYSAVGYGWADATLMDRVDALRLQTAQIPTGTWTVHVKALDSVGQYSSSAATVGVTVTSDAASFLVDTKQQTTPQYENMFVNSFDLTLPAWTASAVRRSGPVVFQGNPFAFTLLEEWATLAQHYIANSGAPASVGSTYTVTFLLKSYSQNRRAAIGGFGVGGANEVVLFDPDTGQVDIPPTTTVFKNAKMMPLGDGVFRCFAEFLAANTTPASIAISNATTDNSGAALTYTGDGTSGIYISAPMMWPGTDYEDPSSNGQAVPASSKNMAEFSLARTDGNRYFVSEDGVVAATKFPAQADTYGNIAATYHNSMTSTWLGESEDFGLTLGGQWTGEATVADVSGSHTSYLGHSTDGSSWTYPSGLSQKINARFARLKHEALTTATMLVTIPAQSIRIDAIPREEVGTGTSSASGATTITLSGIYVAAKKITITPEGNTARSYTYDNVVLGNPSTFDVYVFDAAGTKIASPFRYAFQGV